MAGCTLGLAIDTLTDWYSGVLSPQQTSRISKHVPACATCQEHLAEITQMLKALRQEGQHASTEREWRPRMWHDLHQNLLHMKGSPMSINKGTLWRGAAALLSCLLLVVLVFELLPHHVKTATITTSLMATPPSAVQAWGNAIKTVQIIPGNNFLNLDEIAPDGTFLIGHSFAPQSQIVMINTNTGLVQTVYSDSAPITDGPYTDGRYISWITAAPAIKVYDLQTHSISSIAQTAITQGQTSSIPVTLISADHGMLIWMQSLDSNNSRLNMTDLASGQTKTIISDVKSNESTPQESWPYIFYQNSFTDLRLYDIATGQTQTLPANDTAEVFVLLGAQLIAATAQFEQGKTVTQFSTLTLAPTIGQWQTADALPYFSDLRYPNFTINQRLFIWQQGVTGPQSTELLAWDRLKQTVVQLLPPRQEGIFVDCRGSWVVWGSTSTGIDEVQILDTAQLPGAHT
jgi:hypothetical protein